MRYGPDLSANPITTEEELRELAKHHVYGHMLRAAKRAIERMEKERPAEPANYEDGTEDLP